MLFFSVKWGSFHHRGAAATIVLYLDHFYAVCAEVLLDLLAVTSCQWLVDKLVAAILNLCLFLFKQHLFIFVT